MLAGLIRWWLREVDMGWRIFRVVLFLAAFSIGMFIGAPNPVGVASPGRAAAAHVRVNCASQDILLVTEKQAPPRQR
jgi:hypothetical protein